MKWLVFVLFLLSGCTTSHVLLGNTSVVVEIADEPQEWAQGLQYRTVLGDTKGMLFVFPQPKTATFWMKNTLVHLDMNFIDDQKRIIAIEKDVPPCTQDPCVTYTHDNVSFVLEVNAGFSDVHGIHISDAITI